jgi:hypothetical protein
MRRTAALSTRKLNGLFGEARLKPGTLAAFATTSQPELDDRTLVELDADADLEVLGEGPSTPRPIPRSLLRQETPLRDDGVSDLPLEIKKGKRTVEGRRNGNTLDR